MLGVEKYFRYVNVMMTLLLKFAIWLVIHILLVSKSLTCLCI